jgi:Mn2+/Fe2+ NRAMP family transporter
MADLGQRSINLSTQLVPLFGDLARFFFGVGLFAAGLSSAITAPYAAAWTAAGLFGWHEKDKRVTMVALGVLAFGAFSGFLKFKPLHIIMVAQVTNALILPVAALFIFYLLNRNEAGQCRNRLWQNALFLLVFLVILIINLKHLS